MSARFFLVSTILATAAVVLSLNAAARVAPAIGAMSRPCPPSAVTEPPAFRADLRRPSLSEMVDAL
jgi:hypothetical protein